MRLLAQTVYRVDHVVVAIKPKRGARLSRIEPFLRLDFRVRIYRTQTLLHRENFHLPNRFGRRHHLPIDVGSAHTVGIYKRKMSHPAPHKRLGAPAPDAAYAKNDHARPSQRGRRIRSHKQIEPLENGALTHGVWERSFHHFACAARSANSGFDFSTP